MTIVILIIGAIGCFAAGMSFMSLLQYRQHALDQPIPGDLLPEKVEAPPPPARVIEPQARSPYAPKPKLAEMRRQPVARVVHWPQPEPAKAVEFEPLPRPTSSSALPHNEW